MFSSLDPQIDPFKEQNYTYVLVESQWMKRIQANVQRLLQKLFSTKKVSGLHFFVDDPGE